MYPHSHSSVSHTSTVRTACMTTQSPPPHNNKMDLVAINKPLKDEEEWGTESWFIESYKSPNSVLPTTVDLTKWLPSKVDPHKGGGGKKGWTTFVALSWLFLFSFIATITQYSSSILWFFAGPKNHNVIVHQFVRHLSVMTSSDSLAVANFKWIAEVRLPRSLTSQHNTGREASRSGIVCSTSNAPSCRQRRNETSRQQASTSKHR